MAKYLLYHGTTKDACKNILKNGISLSENKFTADFGFGFYLTPQVTKRSTNCHKIL